MSQLLPFRFLLLSALVTLGATLVDVRPALAADGTDWRNALLGGVVLALGVLVGVVWRLLRTLRRRQREEQTLEVSESFYRALFETLQSGFNSLDSFGVLQRVNPAFCRMLGYRPVELLGRTLEEITHPGDRERVEALFREVREGSRRDFTFEARLLRRDNQVLWASIANAWQFDARDRPLRAVSVVQDISDRKAAEEALATERAFLQRVIDGVAEPIKVIAPDHSLLMMNATARRLFAEGDADPGSRCYELPGSRRMHCAPGSQTCPMAEVRRTGQPVRTVREQHRGGEVRFFELEASPLWNDNGSFGGIIEAARDVTDRLQTEKLLRENEERLNFLAYHDTLTGLPNRLLFQDRLTHSLGLAQRHRQQLVVMFLDLDRFKNVNDSLGHAVGDQLLSLVADRLHSCLRSSDTVARLGGDEFIFLIEDVEGQQSSRTVADKVRSVLRTPFQLDDHELFVSCSIGISIYPRDGEDSETLVKAADTAMYHSKSIGGDAVTYYSPEMTLRTREMLFLEGNLRRALEGGQLTLHYQPQVDLKSGRLSGVEALVRWNHPEHGLISPGRFIPLAEDTGLIVPIGAWVLREACRAAAGWQRPGRPPVRVSVNISARQFRQGDILATVRQVLAESGLPPACLELEITESVLMVDLPLLADVIRQLTAMGVTLSIDDFGAGYSSLGYLKRFPIAKIKIDRSFVGDLTDDPDDAAIVHAVIALGGSLGIDVVAEGVETVPQLDALRERGCGYGQGYHFSPPVPVADMASLLDRVYIDNVQLALEDALHDDPISAAEGTR